MSKTTYCMTQSQNKPVTLTDAISLDRSEIRCFRSHSGRPDSGNHQAKFPKQKLLKQTSFVLCERVRELVNHVRVLSAYVGFIASRCPLFKRKRKLRLLTMWFSII